MFIGMVPMRPTFRYLIMQKLSVHKKEPMLAHVLTDAIKQIERYQAEYPELYAGFAKVIKKVKADMKALAERLPKIWKGYA